MSPLRLTDEQLSAIMRAAQSLPVHTRDSFLQAVAECLQGKELGDGEVGRAIREVQKRYFDPPILERAAGTSKWSR
jgi:hypothetical protein